MKGKLQMETVGSVVLKGNALGDPHVREIAVYLPPSYGKVRGKRYPLIVELPGYTGTARAAVNVNPWKLNVAERLDRLIAEGSRECVLTVADCFTVYGGSQYENSAGAGRYEDHVVLELVPYLEDKFGVGGAPAARAIMGGSSGGYGALTLGMRHPGVFGHVAALSADSAFEASFGADIPKAVTALGAYGHSAERFRAEFLKSREKWTFDHAVLIMMGMASCWSPNPKSPTGFDLPFDEYTGELIPRIWSKWLEHDPVVACGRYAANLKRLKTLYFDCGTKDEFNLHLGARRLSRRLKALGVKHIHQEGVWGHMNRAPRLDVALKLLASRLRA